MRFFCCGDVDVVVDKTKIAIEMTLDFDCRSIDARIRHLKTTWKPMSTTISVPDETCVNSIIAKLTSNTCDTKITAVNGELTSYGLRLAMIKAQVKALSKNSNDDNQVFCESMVKIDVEMMRYVDFEKIDGKIRQVHSWKPMQSEIFVPKASEDEIIGKLKLETSGITAINGKKTTLGLRISLYEAQMINLGLGISPAIVSGYD